MQAQQDTLAEGGNNEGNLQELQCAGLGKGNRKAAFNVTPTKYSPVIEKEKRADADEIQQCRNGRAHSRRQGLFGCSRRARK